MVRRINQEGLELIKRFEGLELEAYQDVAGIWTIGYGHIDGVSAGMVITEDEAEALLSQDLQRFETGVENLVKVSVNDNEFSALVSFSFNVGLNALKGSTALKRLNKNDRIAAAEALEWWNKAKVNGQLVVITGLARRRAAEKALFLKPDPLTASIPTPRPKPEEKVEAAIVEASTAANSGAESATLSELDENTRVKKSVEKSPRRSNLGGSRTVQGAAAAGAAAAAGGAGMVADNLNADQMEPGFLQKAVNVLQSLPQEVYYVLFGIIILAALWIIVARIDDWSKHRR